MVMFDMYRLPVRSAERSSLSLSTDSSQPSGNSDRMKGGNLPGVVCRTSVGPFSLSRRPTPFEAVMQEMSDRLAVPGDDEIECSFVATVT